MIEEKRSIRTTTLESIFYSSTNGIDELLESFKTKLDKDGIGLTLNNTRESILDLESDVYKNAFFNGSHRLIVNYSEFLNLIKKIRNNYSKKTINYLCKKWFDFELPENDFYIDEVNKRLFNQKIERLPRLLQELISKIFFNDEYHEKMISAKKIINLLFEFLEFSPYEIELKARRLVQILDESKNSNPKDWNSEFASEVARIFLSTNSKGKNYNLGFEFELFFDRKSRAISFNEECIEKKPNSKLNKFFLNKELGFVTFNIHEIIEVPESVSKEEIVKQNLSKSLMEFYKNELLKESSNDENSFIDDFDFWFLSEETIVSNSLNKFNDAFVRFTLEEKKQILLLLQNNLK